MFYHWQDLENTKFVLAVCLKIIGFGVSEKLKCNFEIAEFSSAMVFYIKKCPAWPEFLVFQNTVLMISVLPSFNKNCKSI